MAKKQQRSVVEEVMWTVVMQKTTVGEVRDSDGPYQIGSRVLDNYLVHSLDARKKILYVMRE